MHCSQLPLALLVLLHQGASEPLEPPCRKHDWHDAGQLLHASGSFMQALRSHWQRGLLKGHSGPLSLLPRELRCGTVAGHPHDIQSR